MRDTENAISIKGLTKIYKGKNFSKLALEKLDLDIKRGEFFALLGPNGAGKSTIINILAGLVVPSAGTAEICGYDILKESKQAKHSIGIVPQELVMDPFFTVYKMLELYAGYYGIPKSKRKTDEILHALGLSDKANVTPRGLSGGMRRRLLIAKALVHSPPVLILDEPTAGVDIELRTQLWEYVTQLHKQGTTIILTTHYLEEAELLCNRIAIMNQGKLVTMAPKNELLQQYAKKIVKFYLEDRKSVV